MSIDKLLEDTNRRIDATLRERQVRYGDFTDTARIAQNLKTIMRQEPSYYRMSPDKIEVLELIATKIGRILNGDSEHTDNWHDIAGYAALAEERCKPT